MKSRLFFLGASISEAALPFARNLILARALSPSDFGVAVLVATIWSLSEVCLDLGLDRFVMRHPTVDTDQGGLATLQTIQLLRGLAIAAVIAVNAYVFADLMKAPDLFIPLLVVAASAVIRGLASLRAQVAARDGNFFPHASMILFAQLAWTLVTIVVALLMPSPIAMAWGIAAAHVVAALTSHLFALGKLRLGWSSEVAKEALRFGVPLVPNGMASAVIFMVDRLLVASFYGVKAVGLYTILLTVAFLLKGVLLRYLASVFLPLFADTKLTDLGRNELNRSWLALISGFAFAYSVGVITVAVPLIPFVFGQNYQADTHYAALLGMAAFARCLHVVGVPVTMARGHTVYALYVNFGLACAIGFACAGALLGGSLYAFMLGLFLGELVVAVCVIAGLPRILGQPISFIVRTVGIPYVGLGLISVAALHWQGVVFYSFAACMSVLVLLDLIQRLAPLIGKDYVNSLRRPHAESH